MDNHPLDLFIRGLSTVTLVLFVVNSMNHHDMRVVGLFGEEVEDITTDRLFEDMGQAEVVGFQIKDGVVNFTVILEDRRGQDEFWLIDFQPFVFNGESAINFSTAFLSSNATGSCSNVEQSHPVGDGYFGDDFFQSRNSTGSKELFASYERGTYDANGTRVDTMSYLGKMDNLMNCKHSDGSLAWHYYINTHDIVFTTVLYATNIRPLDISLQQLPESIAYVQTNIELVWTISRTAILNFIIASQAAYEPKMIEMVGRVIVEFDFAIVEPYTLEDGTLDTSKIHLEMGISTYTPLSNSSLLVFMGQDFMYYEADTPGNVMTEILKMPATIIEESPSCTLRREGYCRQQWEFEFTLEMNTTFLTEDEPLDATGVFYFQFDSYTCPNLIPSIDCTNHGLPLWNVSADVTLQTVIDIVDEEMDTVSVTVVKMTNDKGEDLRGGSPVSHMENVTVEVAISPSFLREEFQLELSLFMVCMGEDQSKSSRGCLGSDETERYTAFMGDDFEMEYDPLFDPMYQIESSTSALSLTSSTAAVTEPTRYVEVDTTHQFLLVLEPASGSVHLFPADQVTSPNSGNVLDNVFIKTLVTPSETVTNEFVIISRYSSLLAIVNESSYSEFVRNFNDPQSLHVFQHIYEAIPAWSDRGHKVELFSSYLNFPGEEISYFGFGDPSVVPCNQFPKLRDNQEYTKVHLSPFVPNVSEDELLYLRGIGDFYNLMINWTGSEGEDESDNFVGGNFQSIEQWENVSDQFDGLLINGNSELNSLLVDTVRLSHDYGPWRLQEFMYALILFQPNISSTLVSEHVAIILEDLRKWTSNDEEEFWDFMSTVITETIFDPETEGRITLLEHLQKAAQELKQLYPGRRDTNHIDDVFNPTYWNHHYFDESLYDLLINLTIQKNGSLNNVEYIATSYVNVQADYDNYINDDDIIKDVIIDDDITDDITEWIFGYTVIGCSVSWSHTSSLWVYREPQIEYMETLAGGWYHWSEWSRCSASCEGGAQVRQRQCLDTLVPCIGGISSEERSCNDLRCGLYKDEDNLVHDVIPSGESMTFLQMQQYCESKQAVLVVYPHKTSQDEYIMDQMAYQHIDHIWISPHSPGTCTVLRYNGQVVTDADCSSQHQSFCIKDFVKVFEGFAGIGKSIRDAWFGEASDVDDTVEGGHRQHFVDQELLRVWNSAIDVQEIQVVLFKKDQLVLDLKFDGTGTTNRDWFKAEYLKTAWPYEDILGEDAKLILQLKGESKYKKVLAADKKLGTCDERTGWMMVLDDEENIMCDWQKHRSYPLFLYSRRNTASKWNSQFIGSATSVAILLKYYMQEPLPPPATYPSAIVYSSQNVEAPEEWQKLNYEEYDEENQVHRSDFTNFALSADTAVYTMTAVYGVVEKPARRKRRQARGLQSNLMKSLEYPQVKSIPFAFTGCPKDSRHAPSLLSCECEAPDYEYSQHTYACEPGGQLKVIPSSSTVAPAAGGTKDTSPSMYSFVWCMIGIAVTGY